MTPVRLGRMLQGANCDGLWSTAVALTVLPGGQFTVAGLAAMPDQYYRVPAMRMVLDLAVYLGMLAVFSTVVLFHEDGPLTSGEIAFAFYLLVSGQHSVRRLGQYHISSRFCCMSELIAFLASSYETC